jgi:2-polyprenyl-3-methyl-5-hydroxy-6-metoxy-1,4-benzoquinol methylase
MSGKKGILPGTPWKSIYDTMYREDWTTIDQIELIKNEINKKPKGIIDFGGGRGNVSSAISHLGITAGYVDPYGYEKNEIYNQENILSYDFFEEIIKDLDKYDTIIFCASIEHIPENYSKEIIELCKGMKLIIANTITYHPIQASGIEHCTKIDDNFYDKICNTMDSIIYRQGSHLVGII